MLQKNFLEEPASSIDFVDDDCCEIKIGRVVEACNHLIKSIRFRDNSFAAVQKNWNC